MWTRSGRYQRISRHSDPIAGIGAAEEQGALVFHAGTVGRPQGGYGTNGGRVLTIVGRGPALNEAREAAEQAADAIEWDGLQRRRDIAAELPRPAEALA